MSHVPSLGAHQPLGFRDSISAISGSVMTLVLAQALGQWWADRFFHDAMGQGSLGKWPS